MVDLAKRENLSIRQLYMRVIGQRAHRTVCGTPNDIADAMEEWFKAGACDGFNVLPLTFPNGLNDLVDLVIPELQRRGLFRKEYEGKTLRENLGLPKPVNRYMQQRGRSPRRSRAAGSMAGLVPAIHVLPATARWKSWMPGTRPGMTCEEGVPTSASSSDRARRASTRRAH